jgi:AcrR family transcriptional regulator
MKTNSVTPTDRPLHDSGDAVSDAATDWDQVMPETAGGKVSKWDLRKIRTRRLILRSGRELFARKGFNAPRVEDIARAAGVSRAAFYLHFKSIDEVVQAVFVREIRWQLRRYRSLDGETLRSERRIRGWLERFFASFNAERHYVLIIFRAYSMDPANVRLVFDEHNRLIRRLARRVPELRMLTPAGDVDPVRAIQFGGFLRRIETMSLYSAFDAYSDQSTLALELLCRDLADFVAPVATERG